MSNPNYDQGINITGAYINAKNNVNINSSNNINIKASDNSYSYKNTGGSFYVDIPVFGAGFNLGGEIHGTKSTATSHNNANITAGNNLNITASNDTNIIGANILAKNDLILNTGNNLNIASLQNTSKLNSIAIGGGYGQGAKNSKNGNFNFNYQNNSRIWTDNQTTLIGNNSVTINTGNNTSLTGALIANAEIISNTTNNTTCQGLANCTNNQITTYSYLDRGNLTLTTKSLTIANIEDKDKGRSFGIGGNYQNQPSTPDKGKTKGQDGGGSGGFNLNYSSHDIAQTTFATIGNGNIIINNENISDIIKNDPSSNLASLNRDINNSQVITKNIVVDPINFEGSVSWTNSKDGTSGMNNLFAAKIDEWQRTLQNPIEPFARNLDGINYDLTNILANIKNIPLEQQQPIKIEELPGGFVWVSKLIDKYNDEFNPKTGKETQHPAPNLWPGNPLDPNDKPSVGRGDDECKNSGLCKWTISDKAYHLQFLYYFVPGFKSFSQFHDAGMTNPDGTEKSGAYKFFTIIPYLPANYYGAIGTMLDARNQNKNSSQNNNNSNKVSP